MKRFWAFLLTACMLVSVLASLPVWASTQDANTTMLSLEEGETYFLKGLKKAPRTWEASFSVNEEAVEAVTADGATAAEAVGTLISNYAGKVSSYISWTIRLGVDENGGTYLYPRFVIRERYDTITDDLAHTYSADVEGMRFQPDETVHFTFVVDAENSCVRWYRDGTHVHTETAELLAVDIEDRAVAAPLCIGNSNAPGQPSPLLCSLGSIALYGDIRTDNEIQTDFITGGDASDANALGIWDFTENDKGKDIQNLVAGGVSLQYSKKWLTEEEMAAIRAANGFAEYDYSFAVVGDTQCLAGSDYHGVTKHAENLYTWIVNNIDDKNIQFVAGVGDIVDSSVWAQWKVLKAAIQLMDDNVRYSLIRGNHEIEYGNAPNKFNELFNDGVCDYGKQFDEVTCGLMDETIHNAWFKITCGEDNWLLLALDWDPADEVLDWANQIIAANPDHKVIITTHAYTFVDGTTLDLGENSPTQQNKGDAIWSKVASQHENVVMVFSGHISYNNIAWSQAKGIHGNTVTQFLIDPQGLDDYYIRDENDAVIEDATDVGYVTMLYFNEGSSDVWVEYVSTGRIAAGLDAYYYQNINKFYFDYYSNEVDQETVGWNCYKITPDGTGTAEDPYIIQSAGNLMWMSEEANSSLTVNTATFQNMYFKQVCDIDLNGRCLKSIGYYYTTTTDDDKMRGFGGHYDGGGYRIHNGRIIPRSVSFTYYARSYACGLFGTIYGGSVENLTLDNVTVYSRAVTGGIVGRAFAPTNGTATADFNLIQNCHVTASCRILSILPPGGSVSTDIEYDNVWHVGVVGSVCGIAYGTTIRDCTSSTNLTVDGNEALVGGIVGTAGYNTVVQHCGFTGSIVLTDNKSNVLPTFGGIVGLISPNGNTGTQNNSNDVLTGGLTVKGCYSTGSFTYTGTEELDALCLGGIVGHARYLFAGESFVIDNCYNGAAFEAPSALLPSSNDYWIGGIVGQGFASDGASEASLIITNCASVAVAATGGTGTNEYRYADVCTADGLTPVVGDLTVTTKSSDEIAELIKGVLWFGILFKDTDGSVLSFADSCIAGTTSIPQYTVTDNTLGVLIGWMETSNGSHSFIPVSGEIAYEEGDVAVYKPVFLCIRSMGKPSIRLTQGSTGMRYTTEIPLADWEKIASFAERGTLIVPESYVDRIGGKLTHAALDAANMQRLDVKTTGWYSSNDTTGIFAGSIANIKIKNHALNFAGVGYVKLTYSDGSSAYFYATESKSAICNVYSLAYTALHDRSHMPEGIYEFEMPDGTYSPYNQTQIAVLKNFLAPVVALTGNASVSGATLTASDHYTQEGLELTVLFAGEDSSAGSTAAGWNAYVSALGDAANGATGIWIIQKEGGFDAQTLCGVTLDCIQVYHVIYEGKLLVAFTTYSDFY